jgi:hypothetical protein
MKLKQTNDNRYLFYCEGCQMLHGVNNTWTFNNDFQKPTFSPSILVRGTQPITDEEHELIMIGKYIEPRRFVCHSFVTDGRIQYLNDCSHKLAGQTIELKEVEDWWEDE